MKPREGFSIVKPDAELIGVMAKTVQLLSKTARMQGPQAQASWEIVIANTFIHQMAHFNADSRAKMFDMLESACNEIVSMKGIPDEELSEAGNFATVDVRGKDLTSAVKETLGDMDSRSGGLH